MRKKKNIKKEKVSRNIYLGLAVVLVLVAFAVVKVNRILGLSAGTISSVCKTNGGVLMDKDNCPGDSLKYDLVASGSSSGSNIGPGYVKFIGSTGRILTEEGKMWAFDGNGNLNPNFDFKAIDVVPVSEIIQWDGAGFFLTKNGVFYRYTSPGDVNGQWLPVTIEP